MTLSDTSSPDAELNKGPDLEGLPGQKEASNKDHPVFAAIKACEDDIEKVRNFFEVDGVPLDLEDSDGLTPLMHACWKAFKKLTAFLLKMGANPNAGSHEFSYTSLHFAALTGNSEICRMLLEAGVKVDAVNSVKRTATQMAAFVGNHDCIAVINNYVPPDDVFYFTKKHPFETEAKLSIPLAKSIHKLVMSMNTCPVKVGLIIRNDPNMLENLPKVCQILELMSDREFKNRRDVNEVLSLKFHVLYYIVNDIKKQMEKSKNSENKSQFLDLWIKSMLVGRESDGYPVFQEDFLRQGIKEFPYKASQLFQMLVTNFSHCKNYGDGATASEYINSAFNGQRGFQDGSTCATCGSEKAEKKCSSCKSIEYCDQACQKFHWFNHKKYCSLLKEKMEKRLLDQSQNVQQKEAKND